MSDDNTQDAAEPSLASAGSHGKVTVSVHKDDSACAFPDSRPIRRQRFTLTDAEREAVAIMERVANRTENLVVGIGPRHAKSFDGPTIAATLRGLLERTNYPAKGDSSTGLR